METNNLIPLHQTRTITAYEPSVGKRVFQTTANTFGELKVDLINQGYNLQNVNVTEGFTKLGLVNDATILPKNIEFKGVVSNNLAIVMTPKENCELINVNTKFGTLIKKLKKTKFTRYPVYEHDTDNIIGIFNVKDYIMYKKDNSDFNLRNLLFKVKKFNYDEKIDDVFATMQKEHVKMAIVVKNNMFIGIVTLEDAIEEILGNIYDEYYEDDE